VTNRFDNRVYVIDKEPGPTSFEIVARMRRVTGLRKVGHAGTLDPLARGVLLVCTGLATRAVEHFMDLEKEYAFDVRLGVETTTLDAEGAVVSEAPVPDIAPERLREAAASFVGDYLLTPPVFSAIKQKGRRSYDLARNGGDEPAEAPAPRHVKIYDFQVVDAALPVVRCVVRCSRGTYVRSLARDFGEKLGLPASVSALARTRIGAFSLERAFPSSKLTPAHAGELTGLSLDEALSFLPAAVLSARSVRELMFGALPLRTEVMETIGSTRAGAIRLLDEQHRLLAVGTRDAERPRDPLRVCDSFRMFVEAHADGPGGGAARITGEAR
jgi:tRNA pseudouridine55 synthase